MQPSTCSLFLESTATYVLPAVAALLSATAALVASKARSTSRDVQSISSDHERALSLALGRPTRNASRKAAPGRKRSSSRTTTST